MDRTLEQRLLYLESLILVVMSDATTAFLIPRVVKSNEEREKAFLERKGQYYTDQLNFSKIPGTPVAYWVSDTLMEAFAKGIFVGDICEPRVGMATANNDRFIRLWYEVSMNKIGLGMKNREEAVSSKKKMVSILKRWTSLENGMETTIM